MEEEVEVEVEVKVEGLVEVKVKVEVEVKVRWKMVKVMEVVKVVEVVKVRRGGCMIYVGLVLWVWMVVRWKCVIFMLVRAYAQIQLTIDTS